MSLSSSVAEIEKLNSVFSFVVLALIAANTGAWLLLMVTVTAAEVVVLPAASLAIAVKL